MEEKQIRHRRSKERIQEIRKKILSLSEDERNLITSKLGLITIEGRSLSPHNQLMIYMQFPNINPTVVGGFKQWRTAGRSVNKGEHGAIILYPVGSKDNSGNVEDAQNFYSAVVFDVSQTSKTAQKDNN